MRRHFQACFRQARVYMFDSMEASGLDTLKATRALEAAGFDTVQAEALVTVLGGPLSGNVATKEDVRDLGVVSRDLRSELKADIESCRSELKAEIDSCRSELKVEIDSCRSELKVEIDSCRSELKVEIDSCRSELKAEITELRSETRSEFAELRKELVKLGREVADSRGDVKTLRAQMYRLLLVQATVIVGLILGLQQLF